jgi:bacteriorhodopsin
MNAKEQHDLLEANGGIHAVIDKFGVPPGFIGPPFLTGIPFNDAYRYMDWLLTVPLLLMEIVLVMKLPEEEANSRCWTLGAGSALMIVSGYKGELILTGNLAPRWISWCLSMIFFLYIVYSLLVGLADATNAEEDPTIRALIANVKVVTVISWCTYPIVYTFPMLGIGGSNAVVAIQIGYCISDIISKCGVGLMIYQITLAKSQIDLNNRLRSGVDAQINKLEGQYDADALKMGIPTNLTRP